MPSGKAKGHQKKKERLSGSGEEEESEEEFSDDSDGSEDSEETVESESDNETEQDGSAGEDSDEGREDRFPSFPILRHIACGHIFNRKHCLHAFASYDIPIGMGRNTRLSTTKSVGNCNSRRWPKR